MSQATFEHYVIYNYDHPKSDLDQGSYLKLSGFEFLEENIAPTTIFVKQRVAQKENFCCMKEIVLKCRYAASKKLF